MSEESLRDRVESWLQREMPVIGMHGGTSAVREVDPESGTVTVELGGTCSSCGISSRTSEQIEFYMLRDVPGVSRVEVVVAGDGSEDWDVDKAESFMGIDRREGGRGGGIDAGGPDHF